MCLEQEDKRAALLRRRVAGGVATVKEGKKENTSMKAKGSESKVNLAGIVFVCLSEVEKCVVYA